MTQEEQSRQDPLRLISQLVHPRKTTKIGNWNAQTLYQSGNIAQVVREMAKKRIDIMGLSETRWTGQGKMQLINKRFRISVKDTRVFRSSDIGSDHYLVSMKVKLSLRNQRKDKCNTRKKYDMEKPREESIGKAFIITLKNRYQVLEKEELQHPSEHGVEEEFQMMEKAYTETAETVLGKPCKKKK